VKYQFLEGCILHIGGTELRKPLVQFRFDPLVRNLVNLDSSTSHLLVDPKGLEGLAPICSDTL
jgi:hypothetical protein